MDVGDAHGSLISHDHHVINRATWRLGHGTPHFRSCSEMFID